MFKICLIITYNINWYIFFFTVDYNMFIYVSKQLTSEQAIVQNLQQNNGSA